MRQISPRSPGGTGWSCSSRIATITSGAGRPALESRSVATEPSAWKWSAGGIIEIIIGASVWPKSCAITGPIRTSASSRRDADIGAAPYQKHWRLLRSVDSREGSASTM